MSQSEEGSQAAPKRGMVMENIAAYWRARTDFEVETRRKKANNDAVMDAIHRWDAAVAALATCTPATMREADEMQAIALDCCGRDEMAELDNGHIESVFRRVRDALKLWSEQGAPLAA